MKLEPRPDMPVSIAEAFRSLVSVLTTSGTIGSIEPADVYGIEIVAAQIVRMREAQEHIETNGSYYVNGKNGNWGKNPAVTTEQQACDRILKWSKKLGLAPEDRARLMTLDTTGGHDLELD